jgi:hypothetical protein
MNQSSILNMPYNQVAKNHSTDFMQHFGSSFHLLETEGKEETGLQSKADNGGSLGFIGESSRLYLRSLINMEDEWAILGNQTAQLGQNQQENRSYESIRYQEYEYDQATPSKGQSAQQDKKSNKIVSMDLSQSGGILENYHNSFNYSNVYDMIFLGSNQQN